MSDFFGSFWTSLPILKFDIINARSLNANAFCMHDTNYSHLSNSHGGWNKHGGGAKLAK